MKSKAIPLKKWKKILKDAGKKEGKTLTITLSDKAFKDLTRLKEDIGLATFSELLKNSLSLLRFFCLEKEKGNKIIIFNPKTEEEKELMLFI